METRPELNSMSCLNRDCKEYQQSGLGNLTIRKIYGKDQIRYLKCAECQSEFSERKGSALFNTKIRESRAVSVIDHLNRGNGVVGTSELTRVCKDTVSRLIRVTGKVSQGLHHQMVQGIKAEALEFDEKWSFTQKNKRMFFLVKIEKK